MSPSGQAEWLLARFDADFAAELLAEFRDAGRARVDEARAAARNDGAAERAVHTLGSMALTVGFTALGTLCRELEGRFRVCGPAGVALTELEDAFARATAEAAALEAALAAPPGTDG